MWVRTKLFGDRAFAKAAPELWNSLPQPLRDITSLGQFKSRYKTHEIGSFLYSQKNILIDIGSYFFYRHS